MITRFFLCSVGRRRLSLCSFLMPAALVACSRPDPPKPSPPPPTPSAVTPRADRIEPGEIPEGTDTILDFKIPRGMRTTYRGPDGANAIGPYTPDRLTAYVRSRVEVFAVELGASRAVFDHARVKGEPTARPVRIEVVTRQAGSELIIRSLEPQKVTDPELTPEQRWKKHGLDSRGNVLDPTHLQ